MADRLALHELLAGMSRACKRVEGQALGGQGRPARAAQPLGTAPAQPSRSPLLFTGNWTTTTSAALKMEPSERCAIWRSCELILRLLPCVCVRVCGVCLWREERGETCVQGALCGCISGSSAAVLLKLGTGRTLWLTLAKVFSGSKV